MGMMKPRVPGLDGEKVDRETFERQVLSEEQEIDAEAARLEAEVLGLEKRAARLAETANYTYGKFDEKESSIRNVLAVIGGGVKIAAEASGVPLAGEAVSGFLSLAGLGVAGALKLDASRKDKVIADLKAAVAEAKGEQKAPEMDVGVAS